MQEVQNCEVNKVIYWDAEKPLTRLKAPPHEDAIAVALDGLGGEYRDTGATTAPAPTPATGAGDGLPAGGRPTGGSPAPGPGMPGPMNPDPASAGKPPDQSSAARNQPPLTLAAHSQALFREAIVNGTVNQLLGDLRGWIEKIRTFLLYADTGIETADNIVNVARTTLEKELGLTPASFATGATSMQFPASSLQLMWNLIRTPEFQQFTGRMLAQMLKMGLTPPAQGESSG